MKKYIFFLTNQQHLLDVAINLFKNKIAQPIIWIGDDRLYDEAKNVFGDIVLRDLIHRHRNYEIKHIDYSGELNEFFKSINYLRAKDISLKMMDRIDLYGSLSRIDREVYFHKLLIFYLKKIKETKPDFLIASEAPHDYPKYIIYEICKFLNIPSYKLNTWNLVPLMYLENFKTNIPVINQSTEFGKYDKIIDQKFTDYLNQLLNSNDYELSYMKKQRNDSKFINKIKSFFKSGYMDQIKDFKYNLKMNLKYKYNPINPYRHGIFQRNLIKSRRKNNLSNSLIEYQEKIDLNMDYVYFPLHYEHERTTTPDGGFYHDQFIALQTLRKFIPDNIMIIVKEHPSQILYSEGGSRGRSPLFYDLIKSLKNTSLINIDFNTVKLIKSAKFVATISGTVVLESAFLGIRGLSFGSTWYNGCPNIISYSDNLTYNNFIKSKIHSSTQILKFFKNQKNKYAFLAFQNQSQRNIYNQYDEEEFLKIQYESVYNILKNLFKNHE
jgi:hypothetical protein